MRKTLPLQLGTCCATKDPSLPVTAHVGRSQIDGAQGYAMRLVLLINMSTTGPVLFDPLILLGIRKSHDFHSVFGGSPPIFIQETLEICNVREES